MKEFFERIGEKMKDKVSNIDGAKVAKWSCLIGAGILTLIGSTAEQKCKDKEYERVVRNEVAKRMENLTSGDDTDA